MARARLGDRGEDAARALDGGAQLARVEPDVELGEVEAEQLDAASSRESLPAAIRWPRFASRLRRITARSASSSSGVGVGVVSQPPADEGELLAVGLALRRARKVGRGVGEVARVAAIDSLELGASRRRSCGSTRSRSASSRTSAL